MKICSAFPIPMATRSKSSDPKVMMALAQKKNHVADSQSFARCLTNTIRAPKKLMNSGRITFSCFCSRERNTDTIIQGAIDGIDHIVRYEDLFTGVAEGHEETAAEDEHHRGTQAHEVEERRTQQEEHQHVWHCWYCSRHRRMASTHTFHKFIYTRSSVPVANRNSHAPNNSSVCRCLYQ